MFFVKLKSFIRDYFTLTSRERKGALVLAFIICIQIITIWVLNYATPPDALIITTHHTSLVEFDQHMATLDSADEIHPAKAAPGIEKWKPGTALSLFNPNTITDQQWIAIGLSVKQTAVIRNYLNKGGHFKDKEALSKMYCITPEMYKQLEPFIDIPVKEKPFFTFKSAEPKKQKVIVELNGADTISMATLPLIGAGRARMIFKYRERLGGYVSVNQLLEVFTIDTTTFETIRPYIKLDTSKIRKLNVNSDSLSHPYLNRKLCQALIAYRHQHGNFVDVNDLRKVALFDEQMWLKVAPYVSFE